MLGALMRPPGSFKLTHKARQNGAAQGGDFPDAGVFALADTRCQKIVDSLCCEILEGENLRIRQIFEQPRAIYRIELDLPDMSYQRTTLLDEDTLEELLEIDEVRSRVAAALR